MGYRFTANIIVIFHFGFILFVIAGGLLVWRHKWISLLHLPSAIWAVLLEYNGWICPLTPLEISFRKMAGNHGYQGGFIEHYLLSLIYPVNITRNHQILLGTALVIINLVIYSRLLLPLLRQKPKN